MRLRQLLPIAAFVLLTTPNSAHAQLNFTFTPATQTGSPGAPLTFSGTLTNSGSSELFLNGYTTTPIAPDLTLDDTKFFNNVPLSLMAGDSFSGKLFDINIAPTALPDDYVIGFTVLGGSDSSAQGDLATQSFTVSLPPPAVPEANTATLLGGGLAGLGLLALRRRTRRA